MRKISPDISTISQPSTLLVVMPYFRQCTPPEFSATLPPIEQAICDDGVTAIQDRLIGSRHHDGHACPPGPRISICTGKSSTSAGLWVGHPKVGLPRVNRSVLSETSPPW